MPSKSAWQAFDGARYEVEAYARALGEAADLLRLTGVACPRGVLSDLHEKLLAALTDLSVASVTLVKEARDDESV